MLPRLILAKLFYSYIQNNKSPYSNMYEQSVKTANRNSLSNPPYLFLNCLYRAKQIEKSIKTQLTYVIIL